MALRQPIRSPRWQQTRTVSTVEDRLQRFPDAQRSATEDGQESFVTEDDIFLITEPEPGEAI